MASGDIRAGGAVVEINTDETGLRAGLSRAAARIEGFEKRLKDTFGPRSLLKDAAEIALGGGAIAGVTFAAQAIGDAADKVAELNAEFDSGQLSASEYAGELARSIPVLGQMVTMFDKVTDAITGETTALKKAEEENRRFNEAQAAYDKAVAGAEARLETFNPNKGVESLEAIDAAIRAQENAFRFVEGSGGRVKALQMLRAKLAAAEMAALTNPLTLANDEANKRKAAELAAGRLNRNAINADLAREERLRMRQDASLQQQAADEFTTAITDHFVKAVPGVAKKLAEDADRMRREMQSAALQSRLEGIRDQMQRSSAGSFQLPSQLIDPRSYGDSPEVRQLKATEAKIIAAIQELVAR